MPNDMAILNRVRIDNLTPLEQELESRIMRKQDGGRESSYLNCYRSMKQKLREDVYDNIMRNEPKFNNHGWKHVESLMYCASDLLGGFISYNIDQRNDASYFERISIEEIFVLLCSILWHDVAMLEGRNDHGKNLKMNVDYYNRIVKYVEDSDLTRCIIDIACSHSDNETFGRCKQLVQLTHTKTINIMQQSLAAILKFCDEISDNATRIDQDGLKFVIGTDSEVFWRHSESIKTSTINRKEQKIVLDYLINEKYAFKKYPKPNGDKITLYNFILERVHKVYNEMLLCEPFFREFCPLKEIDLTINIKESKPPHGPKLTDDIKVTLNSFYHNGGKHILIERFPELNPKNIQNKLKGKDSL